MNAEWLHNLHLLRPLWLLALPPLWGLAIWLHRRGGRDGNWSQLIDPALLPALQLEAGSGGGRSPWPWLALAWTVAVLALAGPSWQQEQAPAWRGSAAWVVVMDLSPSMAATDLSPDRATRARYAIADLLAQAQDARVGLVVFGGEAFTVTPLTEDVETVRSLLGPLSPDILPAAGDALAPALQQAGELLADRPGQREIIVFTDGFGDASAAFATASRLRRQGIQIHTVEIGTASGAPLPQAQGGFARDAQGNTRVVALDTAQLRALARAGGGDNVPLSKLSTLGQSLQQAETRADAQAAGEDVTLEHWRDGGIWLLPLLLLLAALLARRGWL